MANSKINSDEARWRAESDARTMAEYEQIMSDSKRKSAAIKVARGMAKDLNDRATAMSRVAKSPSRNTKSK